jgi:aspartyl protease family protein
MRAVIVISIAAFAACAIVPRYAEQLSSQPKAETAALASYGDAAPRSNASSSRTVVIAPSRDGHFRVKGLINGRPIDFLVDTGATVIALAQRDAAMLGIRPDDRDYVGMVRTANGIVRVARVQLTTVEIDDLLLHNVIAEVLPPGASNVNLLGLSFLSRLRRYEYANGKLVLEQ